MDYSPIIKRIDSVLKEKNISKAQFHTDIGITQSSVSLWKSGNTNPKIENLEKIADYLEVSLQWLLFGSDPEHPTVGNGLDRSAPAPGFPTVGNGLDRSDKKSPALMSEGGKLSADEWELIATYRDLNDEGRADARKQLYIMQQSGIYKNNRKSRMVAGE